VLAAVALLALRAAGRHDVGGLDERLFLGLVLLWIFALSVRVRRASGAGAP
jgi:hypothetical protein